MGFAVIVPGDDLQVTEVRGSVGEIEDLFPSLVPQGFGLEQPVLAVGNIFTKVRKDCNVERCQR